MGLVRGEPKQGQKHRANIRKIALEAGYERASKSDTLDRRRSHLNQYEGYRSGAKFSDDMEREAAEYRMKVRGRTKGGQDVVREKGLPHNAVIGWAVIYNPPAEVCAAWTDAEYEKFHRDCRDCMAEIEPRLFRQTNIRMGAEHYDEGVPPENGLGPIDRHFHDLGISKDADGHYCGNLIDAKLLIKINEKFPAMMRARGWDMDDLDRTDFERAKEDKEYAAERSAKRRKSGLSVNKHLSKKAQKLLDDASERKQQLESEALARQMELDRTAQEQDDRQKKLNRRARSQRRFEKLILEIFQEFGGSYTKFATYQEAMDAVKAVKDKFISDTEQKAAEAAAAEFQAVAEKLELQKAVFDKMEALCGEMHISSDNDTGRKKFMEAHRVKDGRTLEEVYQLHVHKQQERNNAFLRRASELADEYDNLQENIEQLQR